jgi:hypothetical protein
MKARVVNFHSPLLLREVLDYSSSRRRLYMIYSECLRSACNGRGVVDRVKVGVCD